jgi:hypothetical protein
MCSAVIVRLRTDFLRDEQPRSGHMRDKANVGGRQLLGSRAAACAATTASGERVEHYLSRQRHGDGGYPGYVDVSFPINSPDEVWSAVPRGVVTSPPLFALTRAGRTPSATAPRATAGSVGQLGRGNRSRPQQYFNCS